MVENKITLAVIESRAGEYDAECLKLEDLVAAFETGLEAVKNKFIADLKRQARVVANRQAALHTAIELAPDLFVKPRTFTINGVKVGYTASAGSLVWDDDGTLVALIKKHRPEEIATLIRSSEEPNKAALKSLPEADLKKLGCRIEDAGDKVVLIRVAGDVEKLVNKLISKMVAAIVEDKG